MSNVKATLAWDDLVTKASGYAEEVPATVAAVQDAIGRIDGRRFTTAAVWRVDGTVRDQVTVHGDPNVGYAMSRVRIDEETGDVRESWLMSEKAEENVQGSTVVLRVNGARTPLPVRWICTRERIELALSNFATTDGEDASKAAWEDTV